ncbi:ER membrane protein complex subunit 10 [Drosophila guanche]|uniref:ER membrane protein complex subunit 10 n=1 Tax=Drosophila guanche TaxID=7266 RepID=A0A3B0K225_DROGU|nr:ER membrane protein complex subunit 10 [Drosophila guanche]SPP87373.1 blast:ER membrane protein complex subunit 10 [Drosophila guanche]
MNLTGIVVLLSIVASGWCFLEHDSWITVELHHALATNTNEFSFRGNVTIPSLNSGLSNVAQLPLTPGELDTLKALAKQNEFYRLKATVVYPNGAKTRFLTSNKACSLLQAHLNDVLWISLDPSGFVTGVTASQDASPGASGCTSDEINQLEETHFNTDVLIRHAELAPVPDTAGFIQKVEREREARDRGEVRDNRGFFAKYWMYIVPVVLLVFISGATNQDGAK